MLANTIPTGADQTVMPADKIDKHLAVNWAPFQYSSDLLHDLFESLTPGFIIDIKESSEDFWAGVNKPFEPLEEHLNQVLRDIFPNEVAWFVEAKAPRGVWETIVHFRWLVNFIYVFIPWVFISLFLFAANLTFNIVLNRDWADGNVWLIVNSVYLLVQTVFSWPLVMELPVYMYSFRLFRIMSVFAAGVYNFFYILCTIDWIFQIYWEPTKAYEDYQFVDILINMFLAYNIVFNLLIVPVNWVILIKEISMFIRPMLDQDEGDQLDDQDIVSFVNPVTWYDWMAYGTLPDQQLPTISRPKKELHPGLNIKGDLDLTQIVWPEGYVWDGVEPLPESV